MTSATTPTLPPTAAAEHSRFVQRVRRRWPEALALLAPGAPEAGSISALIEALLGGGHELPAALRIARHVVLERLAVIDVEQGAPLASVTTAMTALAEATLEAALARSRADVDQRHGAPRNAQGQAIDLWIVGMGKLGARELNVSSDIDLVYVYEDEGQTDGAPISTSAGAGPPQAAARAPAGGAATQSPGGSISAHEYFAKVARGLYALIGDVTDDGFVFRVDLALRPNGNSGPPVVSLAMLEEYLQTQGREWERFAWLKSRVVAPRAAVVTGRALALRQLVTPFVYRRYLDYGVFEGLRQLHGKIREEAQRRAAGRPERSNDVKLSRGGIREIEFIVQLLLVVRGGQFPEIRTRSTLKALQRLSARGLMKPAAAERLADGYTFLRRIEHRIQYLDDQQTHLLPARDDDLNWIARSLGLACDADACELLECLGAVREVVATEFDALLHEGRGVAATDANGNGCKVCGVGPQSIDSEAFLETLPPTLAERARRWAAGARVQSLRDASKQRLARLVQRAAESVQQQHCTEDAALRFIDWIEPLLRRESYLALLVERPEVQQRLLRLLGLARWPMRYLMQHPGVIDELADARMVAGRFDRAELAAELDERHQAWERSGEAGEEALLDTLRRAHHAEVFRTLVRDVEGRLTVEEAADDLSALADATLECAMRWAWRATQAAPSRATAVRHRCVRQVGRQGAWLRQRPRRGVRLRRSRRARQRPCLRGLRRVRAPPHHLVDGAHGCRRALRHRHRTATQRQLGAARHLGLGLRAIPARPRQQHGLDLGAPGADAGPLLRRTPGAGRAHRSRAARGAGSAARRGRAACRGADDAPKGARRAAGAAGPVRRQAQRRRHDGRRIRGAVPGAGACRPRIRSCSTTSATSRCCSARSSVGLLAGRRRRRRGRCLPRAAPRPAPRATRRAADAIPDACMSAQRDAVLALWRAVFGEPAA